VVGDGGVPEGRSGEDRVPVGGGRVVEVEEAEGGIVEDGAEVGAGEAGEGGGKGNRRLLRVRERVAHAGGRDGEDGAGGRRSVVEDGGPPDSKVDRRGGGVVEVGGGRRLVGRDPGVFLDPVARAEP